MPTAIIYFKIMKTFDQFIKSAKDWQALAQPNISINDQLAFCASERIEQAGEKQGTAGYYLESADVAWTVAGLVYCLEREAISNIEVSYINLMIMDAEFKACPRAFSAVAHSNWSKLLPTSAGKEFIEEQVAYLQENPRFKNVRAERSGYYTLLKGDDYQNPDSPQLNKILKPSTFIEANYVFFHLEEI